MRLIKLGTTVMFFMLWMQVAVWAQQPAALEAYESGRTYFKLENYQRALPFFEAAIAADSNFVEAYKAAIVCHEQLDQLQQALPFYLSAIKIAPSDKKLHYNLALTYIARKQYQKSVAFLEKALAIDPLYAKAADQLKTVRQYLQHQAREPITAEVSSSVHQEERWQYQLALEAYKQNNYQACVEHLEDYKGPITLANTHYLKGIALQQLGKRPAAQVAYQQAIELEAEHFNSHLNLGRMYYNERQYEKAVQHLAEAYQQRPNDDRLLYDLAKAHYYAPEQQARAAELLERYAQRDPRNGEAWRLLGNSYSALDQPKRAAKAYERARQYGTADDALAERIEKSVANYGNKASEMAKKGNYEGAIAILERAVAEHSEEASLYFNLGINYLEVKNIKKAQEQFMKTIELEPSHAKAYQALGLLHYEQEKYSDAGAYYLAAVQAGKADDGVYYKLGSCWFKLERYQKAADAFQKAIALYPKEKHYYMSLGLTYIKLKEHYDAIEVYKKASALDPNCLECQYQTAICWFNMQEFQRCRTIAEQILERDPDFAKAYLLIGHTYRREGKFGLAADYQKKAQRMDPTLKY